MKHAQLVIVAFMTVATAPASASSVQVMGQLEFNQGPPFAQYDKTAGLSIGGEVVSNQVDEVSGRASHFQANSIADLGGLHAHTFVQMTHTVHDGSADFTQVSATASARVTFTDMIIRGPIGATSVVTSLNLHLSGQQGLGSYVPSAISHGSNSASGVQFTINVPGDSDGSFRTFQSVNGAPRPVFAMGVLTSFNGNMDIATKAFTLPANTPFTIDIFMNTLSQILVDFVDTFSASANSDFGGTLSFATDKPVFTLPNGFTANSVDAGIVNNRFVAPVPIPPTLGLLMLPTALLLRFRQRKRDI